MQIRPRSGLAKKEGIIVVNTPGTIDINAKLRTTQELLIKYLNL